MSRARAAALETFKALHNRSYRLFFLGQIVSVSGTWMQSVAQAWLVLKITNSGTSLGLVVAAQTVPVLVAGPWGGLVADRFDKRLTLLSTQASAAVLALVLGLLTLFGVVQLWMIALLALGLGAVNAVDIPTRQAFVMEMVGADDLTNAVSLNSVIMNGARVVGPSIAGVLILLIGIAPCFLVNAASYVAVIVGLALIRPTDLRRDVPAARQPGQLLQGLRYVWRTPVLRTPLLMMALIGTFAYEFQVTLPLLARFTFHSGSEVYGLMGSFMGAGAVVGGLWAAGQGRPTGRRLGIASVAFGALILLCAAMPDLAFEFAALAIMGAASIVFAATANATIQLTASPEMRGRVMALYAMAFMGSTPIGGPIVGWIGQVWSPRIALAVGGLAALAAGAAGWRSLAQFTPPRRRREPVIPPEALIKPAG